jgi:hypothetical protein
MTQPYLLRAAFAATIAIAALATASPATAGNIHVASPGAACHAANPGATKFTAANHYLTNNNTTAQYVMCYLPLTDTSQTPQQLSYLGVEIYSTVADGTVTCVAQTGAYVGGALGIHSSATRTDTLGMGDIGALAFGTSLVRNNTSAAVTLNCKMDPGTRLGLIMYGDS